MNDKSDTPLLDVGSIEVVYNKIILAVRSISLQVNHGEIVCLLGANGAGKTTTLKACSNLLSAERGMITKGRIDLDGESTMQMTPDALVNKGVVQVLEGRHCFSNLTVEENLQTGAFIHKTASNADIRRSMEKVFDYFPRIGHRRKSLASVLSGGEQQMVAIGRALMAKPRLVLLDEPSMGLAPQLVKELFEIVKSLNENENISFLVAEQNVMVALEYSHRSYTVENGRVVSQGTAEDMEKRDLEHIYFGSSPEEGGMRFRDVKYYHRRRPSFF